MTEGLWPLSMLVIYLLIIVMFVLQVLTYIKARQIQREAETTV